VKDQEIRLVARTGRGACPHCGSWNETPLELVTDPEPERCRNCGKPLVVEPPAREEQP
jgi:hypothetical protein